MRYLCLLRGINVGGKNKVSMSELKQALRADFADVSTYINSGNVIVEAGTMHSRAVEEHIEKLLPSLFKLDSELIKVRAVTVQELRAIVEQAPEGFGSQPGIYHSDVLFPMQVTSKEIMDATETHPDVDKAFEANGVVYFQRLSSQRTKSRLGRIIGKPVYKHITIRSWSTTTKLLTLLQS